MPAAQSSIRAQCSARVATFGVGFARRHRRSRRQSVTLKLPAESLAFAAPGDRRAGDAHPLAAARAGESVRRRRAKKPPDFREEKSGDSLVLTSVSGPWLRVTGRPAAVSEERNLFDGSLPFEIMASRPEDDLDAACCCRGPGSQAFLNAKMARVPCGQRRREVFGPPLHQIGPD